MYTGQKFTVSAEALAPTVLSHLQTQWWPQNRYDFMEVWLTMISSSCPIYDVITYSRRDFAKYPGLWSINNKQLRWQRMISPSNWPFKKKLCIWTTIYSCVVSFNRQNYFWGLYWQKITFCPILNKKFCILPDGQLWEWLTGGVALPQPKCNWSVGFAIARWPVGKASDNARIMLSSLFRYSLVQTISDFYHEMFFFGYFLPTKHHIVYWLIIPSISKKLTLK